MARLNINFPKEYMETIKKLGNDDGFYKSVVSGASKPLKKNLKTALQKHRITGQLENNVRTYVKKNSKTGEHFAIAAPIGDHMKTTKKGKTYLYPSKNVAAHIEYGTEHQTAEPYIDEVQRASESEATQAMQQIINKKLEEMGL